MLALGPFRFARSPKSLAMLAGMSVFAVGVQMVVEKLCGSAAAPAAGAAAAALPFATESSKAILASVLAMAVNLHSGDSAQLESAAQAEHHRTFNYDLQLAVGRTLAKVLRDWSKAQPEAIAEIATALATAAEASTSEHLPHWLAAAEAVQVKIAEEKLRDLCLNHGRMPAGTPFLRPDEWTAFLKELLKSTNSAATFNGHTTLWSALASELELRFPPQFFIDMKTAITSPAHAKAWAAMQLRIQGLVVEQLNAALAAAQAAEAAAKRSESAADAALRQGLLTHQDLLRLASQVSADMQALWQQLDKRDQEDLGTLRAEMTTKLTSIDSTLTGIEQRLDTDYSPRFQKFEKDTGESGRFVFRNERLTIVGREDVLADLDGWLRHPRPFCWELITGPAVRAKAAWHSNFSAATGTGRAASMTTRPPQPWTGSNGRPAQTR